MDVDRDLGDPPGEDQHAGRGLSADPGERGQEVHRLLARGRRRASRGRAARRAAAGSPGSAAPSAGPGRRGGSPPRPPRPARRGPPPRSGSARAGRRRRRRGCGRWCSGRAPSAPARRSGGGGAGSRGRPYISRRRSRIASTRRRRGRRQRRAAAFRSLRSPAARTRAHPPRSPRAAPPLRCAASQPSCGEPAASAPMKASPAPSGETTSTVGRRALGRRPRPASRPPRRRSVTTPSRAPSSQSAAAAAAGSLGPGQLLAPPRGWRGPRGAVAQLAAEADRRLHRLASGWARRLGSKRIGTPRSSARRRASQRQPPLAARRPACWSRRPARSPRAIASLEAVAAGPHRLGDPLAVDLEASARRSRSKVTIASGVGTAGTVASQPQSTLSASRPRRSQRPQGSSPTPPSRAASPPARATATATLASAPPGWGTKASASSGASSSRSQTGRRSPRPGRGSSRPAAVLAGSVKGAEPSVTGVSLVGSPPLYNSKRRARPISRIGESCPMDGRMSSASSASSCSPTSATRPCAGSPRGSRAPPSSRAAGHRPRALDPHLLRAQPAGLLPAGAWVIDFANQVYMNSQFAITIAFLVWLYLFRNDAFYFVRNMFMVGDGLRPGRLHAVPDRAAAALSRSTGSSTRSPTSRASTTTRRWSRSSSTPTRRCRACTAPSR